MAHVSIEMPEGIFSALHQTPEEFAQEIRVAAAIHWYSRGEISQGRGAEIAGLSRSGFLEALYKSGVSACQVTIEELGKELELDLPSHRERLAVDTSGQGQAS